MDRPVEQATAAPGEKRRRAKKVWVVDPRAGGGSIYLVEADNQQEAKSTLTAFLSVAIAGAKCERADRHDLTSDFVIHRDLTTARHHA